MHDTKDSVRPKELTAENFSEIFGQFSAETISPSKVIFGCSVFCLKFFFLAKDGFFGCKNANFREHQYENHGDYLVDPTIL